MASDRASSVRPLVPVPRPEGGTIVLTAGPRTTTLGGGDFDLHRDVLELCDGSRTVEEIVATFDSGRSEEADRLLRDLLDRGAAVDCTQAYRLFHAQSSVASRFIRPITPDEVESLRAQTFRPPALLEARLPLSGDATAVQALAGRRRSATPGEAARDVSFAELASILRVMYGHAATGRRPVPSGGGLYPLVLHVLVRRTAEPLEPGLFWYDPGEDTLRLVRPDRLGVGDLFVPQPMMDVLLAREHPVVFISAELERPSRKYGNRAYRFALIEAGAAMQNAHLAAVELDLPVRAAGGLVDERAHTFLDLPDGALPLLALLLGS